MLTGGMGGTGQAAQMAAEAQADRQMAMLGAPPPSNPRMAHLKQLYARSTAQGNDMKRNATATITNAIIAGCAAAPHFCDLARRGNG